MIVKYHCHFIGVRQGFIGCYLKSVLILEKQNPPDLCNHVVNVIVKRYVTKSDCYFKEILLRMYLYVMELSIFYKLQNGVAGSYINM